MVVKIGIFRKEELTSESDDQRYGRKLKGWVKWTAGIVLAGAIGYGANHYTGDKTGLEKLITRENAVEKKSASQYQGRGNAASENYAPLTMNDLKSALTGLNAEQLKDVYIIWIDREGKIMPVAIRGGITDNTYTEVKEVLGGELKEGDLIITGYATPTSKKRTQSQSGQNTLRSLQRIIR